MVIIYPNSTLIDFTNLIIVKQFEFRTLCYNVYTWMSLFNFWQCAVQSCMYKSSAVMQMP